MIANTLVIKTQPKDDVSMEESTIKIQLESKQLW
jgi:hypothetical protein